MRTMLSTRLMFGATLIALLGSIPACSAPASFISDNSCSSSGDCEAGVCRMNLCVVELEDSMIEVGLEIVPSEESATIATLDPMSFQSSASLDITVPAAATIAGTIRDAEGNRVQAELVLRTEAAFDSSKIIESTTQTMTTISTEFSLDFEADYATRALQGRTYNIAVLPTGDARSEFPPLYYRDVLIGDAAVQRWDIQYEASFDTVQGLVVTMGEELTENPLANVTVRAIDPETQRPISSVALTQEASESTTGGFFELILPASTNEFLLRLSASSERPTFPTIDVDPSLFFPGEETPRIRVPNLTSFEYSGTVETNVEGTPIPIADAVVTAYSATIFDDATGITGRFQATTTTDASGAFTTTLLPGDYWFVIAPPMNEELPTALSVARRSVSGASGASVRGQVFELSKLQTLTGTVTANGVSLSGANIIATPTDPVPISGFTQGIAYARAASVTSTSDGAFSFLLDPGSYHLTARAPAESGFAWGFAADVESTSGTRDIELSMPISVDGTMTRADGSALSGATVNAYAAISNGVSTRRLLVGRTTTSETGEYRLLLPSDLPGQATP